MLSDGITIVNAPTAGASASAANEAGVQGESCAAGWFFCGSQAGGGCCPSGYECAGSECLVGSGAAAAGAAASVAQEAASGGAVVGGWSCCGVAGMCVVLSVVVWGLL